MASRKLIEWSEVGALFKPGISLMYGGFLGVGTPAGLVRVLREARIGGLTLIGNDAGRPDFGVGPLVVDGLVARMVTGHIGTNPVAGRKMMSGELAIELVPLGTLYERIRAGGAGLGGVLTPTGVGTSVEEGKTKLTVQGRDYLLELPLRADVAILKARRADESGNLIYERSAQNANPVIALAADLVIAEVDEIVPTGAIDPDAVMTPGALVDKLVLARGD